jgi:hypothetical protein
MTAPLAQPPSVTRRPDYGSRKNPSPYDGMARVFPDEPYFLVRAKDPLAPALVELHAYIGAGQTGAARAKLEEILQAVGDAPRPPHPQDSPKHREAFLIAQAMEAWQRHRLPLWQNEESKG